jgi:hypothetical protein
MVAIESTCSYTYDKKPLQTVDMNTSKIVFYYIHVYCSERRSDLFMNSDLFVEYEPVQAQAFDTITQHSTVKIIYGCLAMALLACHRAVGGRRLYILEILHNLR